MLFLSSKIRALTQVEIHISENLLFLSSEIRAFIQVEIHIRENLLFLSCKVRGKSVHKRNILETICYFYPLK